jgi:hypothetical protein
MRKCTRVVVLLALFGAIAAGNTILAADPNKEDITVIGWGNAPGCDPTSLLDGKIFMSNSSDEYWYKVQVWATLQNQAPGPTHCPESPPPYCEGQACECDLGGTFKVEYSEDRVQKTQCLLSSCTNCAWNCDNVSPYAPECDPPHHCTCVFGTYKVLYYSVNEGESWVAMPPSFKTPIDEKEQHEACPLPLGPDCS